MALRKFGDDTPRHADEPIAGDELSGEAGNLFNKFKDEILAGQIPQDVPDDLKDKVSGMVAILGPITAMALEAATTDLLDQARAAQRENRETGSPGPVFHKFLESVEFYLKIESESRLEIMLAARLITLLAAAYEDLGEGATIDIQDPKYTWK